MSSDQKEISYYKVLEFLDKTMELCDPKPFTETDLISFKRIIRDNKYVSTYIRALKRIIEPYNSLEDFKKMQEKNDQSKSFDDLPHHEIRNILNAYFGKEPGNDSIQVIRQLVENAIEREGKICDAKDSIHPGTIMGRCSDENHNEITENEVDLTEEEQIKFNKIRDEGGWDEACDAFEDKFNPVQELQLAWYNDEDTAKFDDENPTYICRECLDSNCENGDFNVSCDNDF